jgi:hypothetical protein
VLIVGQALKRARRSTVARRADLELYDPRHRAFTVVGQTLGGAD